MYYKQQNYLDKTENIIAFVPIRQDGRLCCRVFYRDGSWEDVRNKPEYVLNRIIAFWFRSDLKSLREHYRELTGDERSRKVPVMLKPDMVFVPLRLREIGSEPKRFNQGYISMRDYRSHSHQHVQRATIDFMETDLKLECMQKVLGVDHQMQRAEMLHRKYMEAACAKMGGEDGTGIGGQQETDMFRHLLTNMDKRIMLILMQHPAATYEDIAKILGESRARVAHYASNLHRRGFIWRIGSNRHGAWDMSPFIREYLKDLFREEPIEYTQL